MSQEAQEAEQLHSILSSCLPAQAPEQLRRQIIIEVRRLSRGVSSQGVSPVIRSTEDETSEATE